jgi:DNA mismatch endonuclease (patch repair protein)
MKKIRSNNTGPELVIRKLLWENGYRYRLNAKKLPGKPDIVLNKYKTIIFVDGEFWHGFNWEQKRNKIKANREYKFALPIFVVVALVPYNSFFRHN